MIELSIGARESDIGNLIVKRLLPTRQKRSVGPFVFFDHMGPATFPSGEGLNVLPHPHIGLATVTYLFHGEIIHRDSLGYEQAIQPGAVNLMTAGSGIVHSERTSDEMLARSFEMEGIQTWLALPKELEDCSPAFAHYPEDDIPVIAMEGVRARLLIGAALGTTSPVAFPIPALYLHVDLESDAGLELPAVYEEIAVYVVSGVIEYVDQPLGPGALHVLAQGEPHVIEARSASRIMVVGGQSLDQSRQMFWNFVSTSKDKIEFAKQRWLAQEFPKIPGDADEFVPLPH